MRILLVLPLALCASLVLGACNETDPEALYIDVRYQLRCKDCSPRTNDGPVRDVHDLDGDGGFDLSCTTSTGDEGRLIDFSLEYTDPKDDHKNISLVVDQAGLGDAPHGAACSLKVSDGGSTYEGRCANGETTDERPCAIALERSGDIVRGTLDCDRIPIQDMLSPFRYLKAPSSDKPAQIEIRGCTF